jgi:hypothetical protein
MRIRFVFAVLCFLEKSDHLERQRAPASGKRRA